MISIIIPCWIVNEELFVLTKNILNNLGQVDERILIDNGSTQGGGYLREKADVYIRNKNNLGYAKAVNQGLKLAKNELIAISNNDIIPSSNWQDVAKEVLSDEKVYSCHFRMTDYEQPFEYGTKIHKEGKERWCTQSFFVINTKGLKLFFDENYFNSYDDWDYQYQIRQIANFQTAYTDKACYQHAHSSSQKYIKEREENNKRNREYFKDKWGSYAEDLFAKDYPLQVNIPYEDGFFIEN